ncbi:hypothetical protein QVD17_20283 [Tagetes erecta]|uniref:Protein transport protein Sec61 subunit beta n=1 Tax=Tagetes erecta TaxID=13708 RepID=A0AAD8KL86_TARER|nr:hypothetical protein QVD17_20283 [Tagetes erecta]
MFQLFLQFEDLYLTNVASSVSDLVKTISENETHRCITCNENELIRQCAHLIDVGSVGVCAGDGINGDTDRSVCVFEGGWVGGLVDEFRLQSTWLGLMALNGGAPPRGSAAAAAANLRRRRTSGAGGAAGGTAGNMLQFYTDDAPGLKISPNVVLVMSIGFIAFVAVLHVMGKLYFVRKD